MDIYVVQNGDTINSIADKFGISVERLISDNGIINPSTLVVGQTIVILYPQKTYIIKQGDTLQAIADSNGCSILQLLRNNPFLYDRDYIYPGETIVISYNTIRDLQINGYSYVFINDDILKRTLPYLTYLSIFNYSITENGSIVDYGDDIDIIRTAKEYQAIPLLMISAFSPTGELNLNIVYNLLLNEEKQENLVNEMLLIVKEKGFSGVNALISNLNENNQRLYFNVLTKLSKALRNEGYILMVTIRPDTKETNDTTDFESIDYKSLSMISDRLIFLKNTWGTMNEPPSPVSNISLLRAFINFVTTEIPQDMISVGKPIIGYDW